MCVTGIQTTVDLSVWQFVVFFQQCQGCSCKCQNINTVFVVHESTVTIEHICECVLVLQYVEKMDLSGFVSLKDDCSRDRNLEAARLILRMKDGETKLTVMPLATQTHIKMNPPHIV